MRAGNKETLHQAGPLQPAQTKLPSELLFVARRDLIRAGNRGQIPDLNPTDSRTIKKNPAPGGVSLRSTLDLAEQKCSVGRPRVARQAIYLER